MKSKKLQKALDETHAHPVTREHCQEYQKRKAKKAIKRAKYLEENQLNSGKKWVLLRDGKTRVLR